MIPEDMIESYLRSLLGHSTPGQTTHSLLIAAAGAADKTPLGFPQADKLKVTLYAIAPDGRVDVERFIAQTIMTAVREHHQDRRTVYFVGLATEIFAVHDDGSEVTENQVRQLMADRKLDTHPAAVEVTRMYAACRDGRRWIGEHYLTGPRAGDISGPELRVGALSARESGPHQRLVRGAVGL